MGYSMKNNCGHKNRKNLSSNNNPYSGCNYIEVKCLGCGFHSMKQDIKMAELIHQNGFKKKK